MNRETVSEVTIYSDGACKGNPGPGGWGALLVTGAFLSRVLLLNEEEHGARVAVVAAGVEVLASARASTRQVQSTIDTAYDLLKSYVLENDKCFQGKGATIKGRYIDREDVGGRLVVAILPTAFNEALKKFDMNERQVANGLLERGLLVPGDGEHLKPKTSFEEGRQRCYWLILDEAPVRPAPDGQPKTEPGQPVGQRKPAPSDGNPISRPSVPVSQSTDAQTQTSSAGIPAGSRPHAGAASRAVFSRDTGTTGTKTKIEEEQTEESTSCTTASGAPVAAPAEAAPGQPRAVADTVARARLGFRKRFGR